MPDKKKLLTRKEIRRFKKAELFRICRDAGIDCKGKLLKNQLVDKIFKSKKLRSSLQPPPKRKLTEKQRANLLRLSKRKYKDEEKIKGKAQTKVDGNIVEDTMITEKIKPRYKEIVDENKDKSKVEKLFKKADNISNDLTTYNKEIKKQDKTIKGNINRLRESKKEANHLKAQEEVIEANSNFVKGGDKIDFGGGININDDLRTMLIQAYNEYLEDKKKKDQ